MVDLEIVLRKIKYKAVDGYDEITVDDTGSKIHQYAYCKW
jgi:hypothetical protein